MPRRRNRENEGLPPRSRWLNGSVRYQVPPGQEQHWDGKKQFTLGKTAAVAWAIYGHRIGRTGAPTETIRYVHQVLDRYVIDVVLPNSKSARTRDNKLEIIPRLNKVFGQMEVVDLKPTHGYQYVLKRKHKKTGKPAITAAHREFEVMSDALTYAVMWGVIDEHPWKGEVRFKNDLVPQARTRYIEDWELIEALSLKPRRKRGSVRMIQAYIRLKLRLGLRMTDMLLLRQSDCDAEGIHVTASKTANSTKVKQVFTWVDETGKDSGLRAAVDACLKARPLDIAPFIFCTDEGECYVDADTGRMDGFESVWARFMDRVLRETKVKERFAERDLRAKVGSDIERIEDAQRLLGHADSRTTQEHYRRRAARVRPAKPTVNE
jgi:integrase